MLEATGGKGVDVILDCVGGSHAAQNANVLAKDAKWVVYGLMGGAKPPEVHKEIPSTAVHSSLQLLILR